jgi:arylsulfatase A
VIHGKLFCLTFAHLLVAVSLSLADAPSARRPNVIVIMADDLGYGDVSCYGGMEIATPNIDRLAAEGLRFTHGYCSASTCTPTRYSFLTGTYAFRTPRTGIAPPNSPAIIPAGTGTIASLLKEAGYATAVIGKWHLGLGGPEGPDWNGELKPGPLEIGFDHCFLLPTTNDRVPQVYVENHRVLNLDRQDPLWVGMQKPNDDHPTGRTHRESLKMDWSRGHDGTIHNGISRIGFYTGGHAARFRDEDLADRWIQESNAWIENNRSRPFFLFFASHDPHVPRMPHERFQGTTSLGFRGDAIAQLDWCVGELMKTLDRLQLTENTLIIFCSDNGPVADDGYQDGALDKMGQHRAAGPFSGGKYSVHEGGTRTPFITRWPGHIEPGVSENIVCTIDLAASCAALTGVEIPDHVAIDSMNVLPSLLGETGAKGRDHLVQQDNGKAGHFGLRFGHWKLLRHDNRRTYNLIVETKLTSTNVPLFQLFDLAKDPAEQHDLIDEEPAVAERMKKRLQSILTGESRRQESRR